MTGLRRRRLDDDVWTSGSSGRHRPGASAHAPCPQRRPALGTPDQSVGGAPKCLATGAVQQEVGGKVDVEQMLDDLLNEDEQTAGHVGRVGGRPDEDVDANGVAGNVEQQKHGRHQQQHLCHLY